MKLFITSPTGYSGKTAVSMALALLLKEQGFNVGYFKPIGKPGIHDEVHDEDAHLAKAILEMDFPLEVISPVLLRPNRYLEERKNREKLHQKIKTAFEKLSNAYDILIIESSCCLKDYISLDLDGAKIAKEFDSKMILIVTGKDDSAIDTILREKYFIEQRIGTDTILSGIIFNYIEPYVLERIKGITYPILEQFNIPTFGIIPSDTRIVAPTVSDIYNVLGEGEVLVGQDKMDELIVEDFLVGAMSPEASLRWFRRSVRKAVILGGDRPDTALAALTTDTSVLILTGNLHPSTHVLVKADERGVPVILVPYDTFSTVRKIEGVVGKVRPKLSTIKIMKELIEKHVDWKKILEILKS